MFLFKKLSSGAGGASRRLLLRPQDGRMRLLRRSRSSTRSPSAQRDFVIITFASGGESGRLSHQTRSLSSRPLLSNAAIHQRLVPPPKVNLHRGETAQQQEEDIITEDYCYGYYLIKIVSRFSS